MTITPLDSFRQRLYLAPVGLWVTLDAGKLQTATLDAQSHTVQLTLAPADSATPSARVRLEQPATVSGIGAYSISGSYTNERGASAVPLGSSSTTITCAPK